MRTNDRVKINHRLFFVRKKIVWANALVAGVLFSFSRDVVRLPTSDCCYCGYCLPAC